MFKKYSETVGENEEVNVKVNIKPRIPVAEGQSSHMQLNCFADFCFSEKVDFHQLKHMHTVTTLS